MSNQGRCGPNGCFGPVNLPNFGTGNGSSGAPLARGGAAASQGSAGSCNSLICESGSVGGLPSPGAGQASSSPNTLACCLESNTAVLMADGSEKRAAEIAVGDILEGVSDAGCPRCQTVTGVIGSIEPCLGMVLEGLPAIVCTASHPFASFTGGWVRADRLKEGDILVGREGEAVKILSLAPCGDHQVHIWTCEPDHTFIAGGLLHHNIIKPALSNSDAIV